MSWLVHFAVGHRRRIFCDGALTKPRPGKQLGADGRRLPRSVILGSDGRCYTTERAIATCAPCLTLATDGDHADPSDLLADDYEYVHYLHGASAAGVQFLCEKMEWHERGRVLVATHGSVFATASGERYSGDRDLVSCDECLCALDPDPWLDEPLTQEEREALEASSTEKGEPW